MSFLKRLAVPIITAALLVGVPLGAAAATTWYTSCSSSTYKVCIFADDGFVDPKATVNGSVSNYNDGSVYYNTNIKINDSANGAKNWYSNQAVVFHNDGGNTGGAFCVNPLVGYSSIGIFNNDRWSSHLVGQAGDRC